LSHGIVSSEHLVSGAVYSDNIANYAILSRHLAVDALDGGKLLDGSITKRKFDFIKSGYIAGQKGNDTYHVRV